MDNVRRAIRGWTPSRLGAPRLDERGFSLVELSVVAAVLGILTSFGIGTFSGAADKAEARAVEVELRSALDSALLLAMEGGGQFVVDGAPLVAADLQELEPVLAFTDVGTQDAIGVSTDDGASTIRLDKLDDSLTRHVLVAVVGRGVRLCTVPVPADCELEDDVDPGIASTPTTEAPTASTTGPGNSGGRRQDGTTSAADRRQNGR